MEWQPSIHIPVYNLFHKINVIFLVSYSETVENRNKNMDTCLLKLNSLCPTFLQNIEENYAEFSNKFKLLTYPFH